MLEEELLWVLGNGPTSMYEILEVFDAVGSKRSTKRKDVDAAMNNLIREKKVKYDVVKDDNGQQIFYELAD